MAGCACIVSFGQQSSSNPRIIGHDYAVAVVQQAVALDERAEVARCQHGLVGWIDQGSGAQLAEQASGFALQTRC